MLIMAGMLCRRQLDQYFSEKKSQMKRILLPALFFPCFVSAQYEALLADTSITWAAVFEMVLPADPLDGWKEEIREWAKMSVLKLQSNDQTLSFYEADHSFNRLLWEASSQDKWKYFADAGLTKPLTFLEILNLIGAPDTIVDVDPETFEEKIMIARDVHCCPQWYPLMKTRSILTYNNHAATFDLIPLSIAPAEEDGNVFYWMKIPEYDTTAKISFDAPEINWAVRFVTQSSSPRITDFQVIKGGETPVMERLFKRIAKDTTVAIYAYGNFERPASLDERDNIFQLHTDTILVINPETYEEESNIVPGGYRPEDVIDIQLIEEWFWDYSKQLPFVRLRSIAPRIPEKSGWKRAIFYLKTGE